MEDIVPVFNGRGCGPLTLQELQEAIPVNHQHSPASCSYQTVPFNPEKVPDASSLGLDITQHFHPPPPFPVNGTKYKNIGHSAGNSQWSLGDLNELFEDGTEKTEPLWQRIRWNEDMVKVLISAVSYARDNASSDGPENEKNQSLAPVKGKWRAISSAMVERGYVVSPQQCEDKLNDLNKKYKRLCDILGESASCDVIENPALLDLMNVSEDTKEDVKRILTCRQLFFREMRSYHNRDRKYLLNDRTLKELVQSGLKGKVKDGTQSLILGMPMKRRKRGEPNGGSSGSQILTQTNKRANFGNVLPEGAVEGQRELDREIISRSLQLEEKKLKLQKEMVGLEKEKFEWLKLCRKEDMELQKMRQEVELMRLENERLAYELKCRETSGDCN